MWQVFLRRSADRAPGSREAEELAWAARLGGGGALAPALILCHRAFGSHDKGVPRGACPVVPSAGQSVLRKVPSAFLGTNRPQLQPLNLY